MNNDEQGAMLVADKNIISSLPGVKSRPAHAPLIADPAGRHHLVVAEAPGLDAVLRVAEALADSKAPIEVYWLGEVSDALAGRVPVSVFDNQTALSQALEDRLASSNMGLRLYLVGREAFVWEASLPARTAGLREDEIQREACGSLARRVFCVHCRHMLESVTTNPVPCPSCGVLLEVRDHFSRVLAAYIGVCINAENPNEIPVIQEQFS